MNSSFDSYSDFFRNTECGYRNFAQEHRKSQGRAPFSMLLVESQPHNYIDPALNDTLLILPTSVESQCNWNWTINDRKVKTKAEVNRMLIVPPNVQSIWEVDAHRTLLTLCIPNSTFRSVLGTNCPRQLGQALWDLSADTWEDEYLSTAMRQLWLSSQSHEPIDAIMNEGLVTSIIACLMKKAGVHSGEHQPVAFPEWRVRKLHTFVQQQLAEDISLDDMADATGLSRRQFSRAFSAQMGETPFRWLNRLRIERAMVMLKESDVALYRIADECGFSDQSHFSKAFKQTVGVTPAVWRLEHRSS
ncbi:AraC family transcriptional regulator [Pseudomonas kermanshahensis]|uniref:helix-turn-helix domain-containing protein n=1 Tax=Pseudomonas kermanshahensis TaxID=2745482 RepID=UPI0023DA9518|nr:AraC family transcriptional regulator [Pseudomonas kermanshahensis]WEL57540.1 AraC family transcriptional regulator [Pseudomonas kermanshahensis]